MEQHELEAAARQIKAAVLQDKEQIEHKFKERLGQLIRDHESDRAKIIDAFLTRISVTSPEDYETLEPSVRDNMPPYVSLVKFIQGCSTLGCTTTPPEATPAPGPRPALIKMEGLDREEDAEGETDDEVQTNEPNTPIIASPSPAAPRRKLPSRPMKTYSKRPAPNDSWRETKRRSNRPKSTAREEPREEPEEELERESEEEPEGEPRDGSPRPIITSVASRPPNKGQRVFMYDLGAGKQPFILHCPTPNCKFVFSRGLTKYGLVVQHFDECGVPHNGVKDIVTRLARPVVTGNGDPPTDRWISRHNRGAAKLARESSASIPNAVTLAAESALADPADDAKTETSALSEVPTERVMNDSIMSFADCRTGDAVPEE